jgi:peptidyl-prolyl cis-trans isomerase A (cyclophilin A)
MHGSSLSICRLWRVLLFGVTLMAQPVHVLIETKVGNILVKLESEKAPKTSSNFLRYVDAGAFDGGGVFRAVTLSNQQKDKFKIQVIQAATREPDKDFPPIALERTCDTGLKHLDGAISMARLGLNDATSSFFICVKDQPELDFGGKRNPDEQGFAVFGRVVRGMEVVQKIIRMPSKEQMLNNPVMFTRVSRVDVSP